LGVVLEGRVVEIVEGVCEVWVCEGLPVSNYESVSDCVLRDFGGERNTFVRRAVFPAPLGPSMRKVGREVELCGR
jgi:hypothetical protein